MQISEYLLILQHIIAVQIISDLTYITVL